MVVLSPVEKTLFGVVFQVIVVEVFLSECNLGDFGVNDRRKSSSGGSGTVVLLGTGVLSEKFVVPNPDASGDLEITLAGYLGLVPILTISSFCLS